MADGSDKARGEWASAACHLFTTEITAPLSVDIAILNTGRDLPDVDLDHLCDAIMGDMGQSAR